MCCDTLFRAERLDDQTYVIADCWLYNSNCVFACSSFAQRYRWLEALFTHAYTHAEGTVRLLHKSNLPAGTPLRGEEVYSSTVGAHGVFVDKPIYTIRATDLPDVYRIDGKEGYLRVPDLRTSLFLRTKGQQFQLSCLPYDEESWMVNENIPKLEVNATTFQTIHETKDHERGVLLI